MLDQQFDVVAENKKRLERLRRIQGMQDQNMSSPLGGIASQQGQMMSNIPPEQMQLLQNASPNFAAKVKAEQASKAAAPGLDKAKEPTTGDKLTAASTALKTAGASGDAGDLATQSLAGAGAGFTLSGGNPYAAAAGAGVGAISAVMGAREARKQRQREAEARAQENIANIAQSEGVQKNQAISNIIMGLRSAFLGK